MIPLGGFHPPYPLAPRFAINVGSLQGDYIPLIPWLRVLLFMWARFARPSWNGGV